MSFGGSILDRLSVKSKKKEQPRQREMAHEGRGVDDYVVPGQSPMAANLEAARGYH